MTSSVNANNPAPGSLAIDRNSLKINGRPVNGLQGIAEIKSVFTADVAALKTRNNGIDEVIFSQDGKNYIAYGDTLDLKELRKRGIPALSFNGKDATFRSYDDEATTPREGARIGSLNALRDVSNTGIGAVKSVVTGMGVVTPGTYLAAGIGVGIGGVVLANTKPDVFNGIKNAFNSQATFNAALKTIGVVGAVTVGGAVLATGFGAVNGMIDAGNFRRDFGSIASVTVDVNDGKAPPPTQAPNPPLNPTNPTNPGVPQTGPNPIFTPIIPTPGGITLPILRY